jgi:phosphoenolpyruvate carboxykinase (GTP)
MGDYFQHWLEMGDRLGPKAPRIFYVNWFRKTPDGQWLWPGFGENSRVLKWMCQRVDGKAAARRTPIGLLPSESDLDMTELDMPPGSLGKLLEVDTQAWTRELPDIEKHFAQFGSRLPQRLWRQFAEMGTRLAASHTA